MLTPNARAVHGRSIDASLKQLHPHSALLPELPELFNWHPPQRGHYKEVPTHQTSVIESIQQMLGLSIAEYQSWQPGKQLGRGSIPPIQRGIVLSRERMPLPSLYTAELIRPTVPSTDQFSIFVLSGMEGSRILQTESGKAVFAEFTHRIHRAFGGEMRWLRSENAWDGSGKRWDIAPTTGSAEFTFRLHCNSQTHEPHELIFRAKYYPAGFDYHFEMLASLLDTPTVQVTRIRDGEPQYFREHPYHRFHPNHGFRGNLRDEHCIPIVRCLTKIRDIFINGHKTTDHVRYPSLKEE